MYDLILVFGALVFVVLFAACALWLHSRLIEKFHKHMELSTQEADDTSLRIQKLEEEIQEAKDVTMNFNTAYIAAQNAFDALIKYYGKASFWRWAAYLSVLSIVLLAALAFSIRLISGNYLLPVLLSGCMFLAFLFFCFSLYKMRFWNDKAARQLVDVRLLDAQLCNIPNNPKS